MTKSLQSPIRKISDFVAIFTVQVSNNNNKGQNNLERFTSSKTRDRNNTKTLQRTQVRGKKSIIGGSSLSLKCQFPEPLVF